MIGFSKYLYKKVEAEITIIQYTKYINTASISLLGAKLSLITEDTNPRFIKYIEYEILLMCSTT